MSLQVPREKQHEWAHPLVIDISACKFVRAAVAVRNQAAAWVVPEHLLELCDLVWEQWDAQDGSDGSGVSGDLPDPRLVGAKTPAAAKFHPTVDLGVRIETGCRGQQRCRSRHDRRRLTPGCEAGNQQDSGQPEESQCL